MKKKINLPFTVNMKGGNKQSFKILNSKQLNASVINYIKSFIISNNSNKSNKINYIKASETK